MSDARTLLSIERISVNFGGLAALSDVSVAVERGEIVALIGPNGAGKTTLLNVVSGFQPPAAGRVLFRGEEIQDKSPHALNRRGIGRTFQAAEIFSRISVRENVMSGAVARCQLGLAASFNRWGRVRHVGADLARRADEWLAYVGLAGMGDRPAASLPAGQQRLLGMARALATGAELLLLDEPGAGLNESEKSLLVGLIARLNQEGKTIVLIEHDMAVVGQLARRIIVLDRGAVIAAGSPATVKSDPKVLEAYLGRQMAIPARNVVRLDPSRAPVLLRAENLSVHYRGVRALESISLEVRRGEIVAILGANGAGKSTLLKTIAGIEHPASGQIAFAGDSIGGRGADVIVRRGISLAPEGRQLFPSLSVDDNLVLGGYGALTRSRGLLGLIASAASERADIDERLNNVRRMFPVLAERRDQQAGTLSGGQGQMLAIGRALMNAPRLLMLDEPSLGLAPQVVDEILATLVALRERDITVLLVEQNAHAALRIADRAYILANGRIVVQGAAGELRDDPEIAAAYLGGEAGSGMSLRSAG